MWENCNYSSILCNTLYLKIPHLYSGVRKEEKPIILPHKTLIMENIEVEKSKVFIIVEIIEYVPNAVVIKTIIKKTTGNVTAVSFDTGEILTEKISPFDTFIQIIEGRAEILINDNSQTLETGQSIIIPAHSRNAIKANERFKMISTIIKSGYE